ncbi:hypothetical protein SteCoe_8321 [Stentor coeruleus]|uniref:Uncharacterized protein n=1 Tax=Stentor coeruleus TaxID=5963 RepID=A0A1R2CKH7_9CILI|nr:hypothetical protein SteCoe_8321 [Stentor coeruleus]
MLRGLNKWLRGIKPKSTPLVYDYLQTEMDNPNHPIDEDTVIRPGQSVLSSSSVAVIWYLIGGYCVYFCTRLSYDVEWDRYYHINFPAAMEYWDKFGKYYDEKTDEIIDSLPERIQGFKTKLKSINKHTVKAAGETTANQGIEVESKIGEELNKLIESGIKKSN